MPRSAKCAIRSIVYGGFIHRTDLGGRQRRLVSTRGGPRASSFKKRDGVNGVLREWKMLGTILESGDDSRLGLEEDFGHSDSRQREGTHQN